MKLLTRTSFLYLSISFVILMAGGITLYFMVRGMFYREIDQNLITEQLLIEETIREADTIPDYRSVFGHLIEVTPGILSRGHVITIRDTAIYDPDVKDLSACRHLRYIMLSHEGKGFTIDIYKPLRGTKKLLAEILIYISLFIAVLLLILGAVNYIISKRMWIPFYRTLGALSQYKLTAEEHLKLKPVKIYEFELLNAELGRMSEKILNDYRNLREFNENAAHEMQTPLAVIRSKLDLLIQDENLTGEQLSSIEAVYEAIRRMSRLNQGLLLISRIDNAQFHSAEPVRLSVIIDSLLEHFAEIIGEKGIRLESRIDGQVRVMMNPTLAEVLISNLLTNAVVHNIPGGYITVVLEPGFLSISNSGKPLNIDPESLFERFRKSDPNRDSVGLGLAIVKRITRYYRMEISYTVMENIHTLKISF